MADAERKIWLVTEFWHDTFVQTFTDEIAARKAYDAISGSYKMLSVVVDTDHPNPDNIDRSGGPS